MAQIMNDSDPKASRRKHAIHLDMTPMVDLAFLLLTSFVLTVTLQDSFVLETVMPEQDTKNQPPVKAERVLTVILGEQNRVYYYHGTSPEVNVTNYSVTGIRKVLMEKNRQIKKMVVLIKPSKESRYQNLIDILDEVSIAQVPYYYIVKETAEEIALIEKTNQ